MEGRANRPESGRAPCGGRATASVRAWDHANGLGMRTASALTLLAGLLLACQPSPRSRPPEPVAVAVVVEPAAIEPTPGSTSAHTVPRPRVEAATNVPTKSIPRPEDPEAVARGERLFAQHCVPCHGDTAEGHIGPSLVDDEWLHGGTRDDIRRTIREAMQTRRWSSERCTVSRSSCTTPVDFRLLR